MALNLLLRLKSPNSFTQKVCNAYAEQQTRVLAGKKISPLSR